MSDGTSRKRRPLETGLTIPRTKPRLELIETELITCERLFIQPRRGTGRRTIEAMLAEDFQEIGASGRRYGRRLAVDTLLRRRTDPIKDNWTVDGIQCLEPRRNLFLSTYDLFECRRSDRRIGY